jgi:peptidoglycan/LPS O-acetylase OafA/YrhL
MKNSISEKPERFYSLDLLRGVAALAVVFWHWQNFFYVGTQPGPFVSERLPLSNVFLPFYRYGFIAVDLFFSLSGFVFFWLYSKGVAGGTVKWKDFAVLRFSRLYPLHFATLLIVAVGQFGFARITGAYFVYPFNDGYHFILNLLFASSWGLEKGYSFNLPVWSVSIEVLLYALFFAYCRLFPRRLDLLLVVSIIGFLTVFPQIGLVVPGRGVGPFFLGGSAFLIYERIIGRGDVSKTSKWLAYVTGSAWLMALIAAHREPSLILAWGTIILLFPLTILSLALIESAWGPIGRRLSFLGDISYSLYLLHFPLQLAVVTVMARLSISRSLFYSPWFMGLFFSLLILASFASYHYFEVPLRKYLRQRLGRATSGAGEEPAESRAGHHINPNASVGVATHRIEWGIALAASALVIALHVVYLFHAGGLGRDEVVSFSVASMPSLRGIWDSLHFDSFPGFSQFVLHYWIALFGGTDSSLRVFGAAVGIAVFGALWLNGYLLGHKIPWVSILLLGFTPLVIQQGDSIRGYGLGMLTMALTFGLIWKVTEAPTRFWIALATLSSIFAVQTLYQNSFFLLAAGLGGMAVSAHNGRWKRVALLAAIGTVAALSVLPYSMILDRMQEVKGIVYGPYRITLPQVWNVLSEALGTFSRWIWVGLFLVGTGIGLFYASTRSSDLSARQRGLALYSVTALLTGTFGFLVFLKILNFPTHPRNYLPLMGFLVVTLDVIFGLLVRTTWLRALRIDFFLLIVASMTSPAWQGVHVRQTNIDLIVSQLAPRIAKDDLILVHPWYCGATFQRYYRGPTPWTTLPPLEQIEMQPLVSFKRQMVALNPIQPVIDQIAKSLESGHRVWLVGKFLVPKEGELPPETPPAPNAPWGWAHHGYVNAWGAQVGHFLRTHAVGGEILPPAFDGPVNPYEKLPVVMVEGWR